MTDFEYRPTKTGIERVLCLLGKRGRARQLLAVLDMWYADLMVAMYFGLGRLVIFLWRHIIPYEYRKAHPEVDNLWRDCCKENREGQ